VLLRKVSTLTLSYLVINAFSGVAKHFLSVGKGISDPCNA
jgi:hypothetical protein